MKIAIIGGHLSPALSIIEKIPEEWDVVFIGRKYIFEGDKAISLEYKTIKELGVEFENLNTGRFQRKFTRSTIPSLLKLPKGFYSAIRILNKHKPDVILGFGGYIQLPVIVAAFFKKIPVVIHEQTLEAGISNQICAKFAKKICISWESSARFFPKEKTVITGIPLRKDTVKINKTKPSELRRIQQIFITGGSSGSHFINEAVEKSILEILYYKIIHQTGDSRKFNDFERLSEIKENLPEKLRKNYIIKKFINPSEFSDLIGESDLIISRAGINTISEIIFFKKPCILIPIPFAQKNEQFKNSLFLKNLGLAEIIEQKNTTSNLLIQKIQIMLKNKDKYEIKNQSNLRFESAADTIIKILKKCAEKK
ncbi:MAG: UDP-N-acetylglucosamine--N-acetylmuramyl-(pentapeptide) pyrophosphoryl-undecaprenol N-acetylglucosamine transferase [Patescibacteria group bacterium]